MIQIDRPFLDYVMSALADAGVHEICLVIGPEHTQVHEYYERLATTRTTVCFAIQREALGTADAVAAARTFASDDAFLALNADNYYPIDAYRRLAAHGGSGLVGFSSTGLAAGGQLTVERIRAFALVTSDSQGNLLDIVEKPDDHTYRSLLPHAYVSMNLWAFTPTIFEACSRVRPSPRGELELQDAVKIATRELGVRFQVFPHSGTVLDLSSRQDIPSVTAALRGTSVSL